MAQAVRFASERPSPDLSSGGARLRRAILWVQGSYFLVTGLWPLVSIRTFKMVTGEKTDHLPTGLEADHWLVMTVGALVTAIALSLLTSAWRGQATAPTVVLAIAAAAGLAAIDVVYVTRQVIAPIYLVDAAVEMILIAAWIVAFAWRPATRENAQPAAPATHP
jgi:hypothetical protein